MFPRTVGKGMFPNWMWYEVKKNEQIRTARLHGKLNTYSTQ